MQVQKSSSGICKILSNHRMRMSNPDIFTDPHLFMEVFKMLEQYHFRLPARRFIQEVLFDKLIFDELAWKVIEASK